MSICKKLLKGADSFGETIQFQFNKEPKFQTMFGGLLTIIIYALTMALIGSLLEILIVRNKPVTNHALLYHPYAPEVNLITNDLKFGVGVFDQNLVQFYDPSYFTFKLQYVQIDKRKDQLSYLQPDADVDWCKNHYDQFISSKYNYTQATKSNQMDNFFCLKDYNVTLEGSFSLDYISGFKISILRCRNGTKETPSKVTCKSNSEINEKMVGMFLQYYFTDRFIDINDYENPVKEYMNVYFIRLDPYNSRFIELFFKLTNITTDTGYIFEDEKIDTIALYDYAREQYDTRSAETNLIELYLESSKNISVIRRSYFKLTDLAAIVGGIYNVCIVVGGFLASFVSKVQVKMKIMNTLFFFDVEDQENIDSETNSQRIFLPNEVDNKLINSIKTGISRLNLPINVNSTLLKDTLSNTKLLNNESFKGNSDQKKSPSHNNVLSLNKTSQKPNSMVKEDLFVNTEGIELKSKNSNLSSLNHRSNFEALKEMIFNKVKTFRENVKGKFKLDFFNILGMRLCYKCNNKYTLSKNIFSVAEDKLNYYLDFLEIVKIFQDFEKMKNILFSKDQLEIFKTSLKPKILTQDCKGLVTDEDSKEQTEDELKIDLNEIYKSYSILKENEERSDFNPRLLSSIDRDLKVPFEILYDNK